MNALEENIFTLVFMIRKRAQEIKNIIGIIKSSSGQVLVIFHKHIFSDMRIFVFFVTELWICLFEKSICTTF